MLQNYFKTFVGSCRTIAKLSLECDLLGYIFQFHFLRTISSGTKALCLYETADTNIFQSKYLNEKNTKNNKQPTIGILVSLREPLPRQLPMKTMRYFYHHRTILHHPFEKSNSSRRFLKLAIHLEICRSTFLKFLIIFPCLYRSLSQIFWTQFTSRWNYSSKWNILTLVARN